MQIYYINYLLTKKAPKKRNWWEHLAISFTQTCRQWRQVKEWGWLHAGRKRKNPVNQNEILGLTLPTAAERREAWGLTPLSRCCLAEQSLFSKLPSMEIELKKEILKDLSKLCSLRQVMWYNYTVTYHMRKLLQKPQPFMWWGRYLDQSVDMLSQSRLWTLHETEGQLHRWNIFIPCWGNIEVTLLDPTSPKSSSRRWINLARGEM